MTKHKNKLYYGDCLTVMQGLAEESVDLIYLDPPFNSKRSYNAIYKDSTGLPLPEQIEAFCDLWEMDSERERALNFLPLLMREYGIDDVATQFWLAWTESLRGTQPQLLAYLSYMVERLLVMKRLLKKQGSIYTHCDPTASHYIKVMMDIIFGHVNFQNEIIWCYKGRELSKKRYNRKHDVILFYAKSAKFVFNWEEIGVTLEKSSRQALSRHQDERGKWFVVRYKKGGGFAPLHTDGNDDTYRQYVPERVPPRDWLIVDYERKSKRLGYPTQKPLDLLKRIIKVSSNKGDVVLDPFCGCATTIAAAHEHGRNWIGIDIAIHAVKRVARARLGDNYGLVEGKHYEIAGIPQTLEGAQDLWSRDPYQFQKWAVEQVGGFVTANRSADGGIDGRLYFMFPETQTLESMVLEVKGGKNVGIKELRTLLGVLEQDKASLAGLIIMRPLGDVKLRNFKQVIASAGDIEVLGVLYPRLQLLNIAEILEGKRFATPSLSARGKAQPTLPYGDQKA